jgi:hypothetical protein
MPTLRDAFDTGLEHGGFAILVTVCVKGACAQYTAWQAGEAGGGTQRRSRWWTNTNGSSPFLSQRDKSGQW